MLEALVGEGAMGLVYRAHHARLNRRLFALKLMFGDVAADAAMRLRFAQEADSASRFCHQNVVSVVDFGRTEHGILYLAMDYVDGETLATLIRRESPLDENRVVALSRQLCRGLGHAHHAGLVHRDFKPANIAIATGEDGNELVRILDFGLAISEREGDRIGRLTENGLVVGTPIYIAPEQAKDQPVDHRADLFALGVVMYEMLAGKPPFEGSGPEIARANVQKKPPPLSERNSQVRVNPELEKIVFRLLEKRAADRFQTAEDVIAALDRFEQASRTVPSVESDATQSRRSPVLWLSGRSSRRLRRELASESNRLVAAATPAPAAPVCEAQDTRSWGSGCDGQPTVGMEAALLPLPRRRRSVATAAWVASAVAAALVATMLTGPRTPGGREATAAVVPDEERAERPSNNAALELTGFIGSVAVSPLDAAQGLFGGKMDPAPSRCSNVPNAERIAAEARTRTRAPNADKPRRSRNRSQPQASSSRKSRRAPALAARSPVR